MIQPLIERLRAYVAAATPSLAGCRGLLAVSGGADSSAALALLCEAELIDPRETIAAYFDHRLRDRIASAGDRPAVEALCSRYGIPLVEGAWNEPRASEAAARDARYVFLAESARQWGARVIVTGHTADDQAETVLMHALRGAGLHGLRGMAPEAACVVDHTIRVVRPLLCVTREETRAACRALGIEFRDDETNADRRYARNRIRLDVMPALAGIVASPRDALLRVADDARTSVAALELVAAPLVRERGGMVVLPREPLRALPAEVVSVAFRLALVRLLGDAREFDRRHYVTLARSADATTGSTFTLPRGVVLTVDPYDLVLSVDSPAGPTIERAVSHALPFAGAIGAWDIAVAHTTEPAAGSLRLPVEARLRGRRPGDRLRPLGMRGTKKLQDYYVDRKVPRRHRDAAPLIAVGSEVLWTPFGRAEPGAGEPFTIEAREVHSSA